MPWVWSDEPESTPAATAPTGATPAACPLPSSWPTSPPSPSDTLSVAEYKKLWEEKNCRPMTAAEEKTLARGCIGITAVELGETGMPNLDNSYATLAQAKARAAVMATECGRTGSEPMIFSKRFWSDGKSYTPDPKTGKVDMSGYKVSWRPADKYAPKGYVNFDYGIYDEASNSWFHANHSEPGMKVYRSTEAHYSRPLRDFDGQVFAVACGKH